MEYYHSLSPVFLGGSKIGKLHKPTVKATIVVPSLMIHEWLENVLRNETLVKETQAIL
jgi:hypothetical protein